MSRVRRALVVAVFALFLLTLLSRPVTRLVSRGSAGEGFDPGALLVAAPGVVVLAVMAVVAVVVTRRADDADLVDVLTTRGEFDRARGSDREPADDAAARVRPAPQENSAPRDSQRAQSPFLSGQGGARNRGFEIEDRPPETELDDHLRYLEGRLDEEDLDPETEWSATVPAECPQPYCEARWEDGGFGGGSYELLDDRTVRCVECDGIATLE